MRRRAAAVLTLALAGAMLLPGTGSGHPGHQVAAVSVGLVSYQPADISIVVGDGINWIFRGPDTNHSITADQGQSETFDSDPGVTEPSHAVDDTYYHDFFTTGTFSYHCKVHPQMRGTVEVTDPLPPSIDSPVVKPGTFCTGRGCPKPRLRLFVSEPATLLGAIERRSKRGWKEVRELAETALETGRNVTELRVKGLAPGKYRVEVRARDSFSFVSAPEQAEFVISDSESR